MKTIVELLADLAVDGGAIVCSAACTEIEIADAQANGRFAVDAEGIGYVWRRQAWLDHHANLERVAEIAEMIQDDDINNSRVFLVKQGWREMRDGYWTHSSRVDGTGSFHPDTALSMEMDIALNELLGLK